MTQAAQTLWRIAEPDADPVLLATDPNCSVWVNASAGSGKTNILTWRVLSLLLHGTPPHKILCLTYTKAAAAEMSSRIQSQLAKWISITERELESELSKFIAIQSIDDKIKLRARRLFALCLDVPDGLKIQTLHSFCQSVLSRFPIEAGVIPHFQVCDDRDAKIIMHQAVEHTIGSRSDLNWAIGHISEQKNDPNFLTQALQSVLSNKSWIESAKHQHGGIDEMLFQAAKMYGLSKVSAPHEIISSAVMDSSFDKQSLKSAAMVLSHGTTAEQSRAQIILDWIASPQDIRKKSWADYAGIFITQTLSRKAEKNLYTQKSHEKFPQISAILLTEADRIVKAEQQRLAAHLIWTTRCLLHVALAVDEEYSQRKLQSGFLDFDDLIQRTLQLLQKPGLSPWVLFKLDGGIDHILIDEAQDTSPEQWAIIRSLAQDFFAGIGSKSGQPTIFAVGDPKQSIYSFQNADPRGFIEMQSHFARLAFHANQVLRVVPLTHSYRTTEPILRTVDCVFHHSTAKWGVSAFSKDNHQILRHHAKRDQIPGFVEIWPPSPAASKQELENWRIAKQPLISASSAQKKLAIAMADKIQSWIQSGELIGHNIYTKRPARPIRPGDIMILVRQRGPIIHDITRALKFRNIPVAGIDRLLLGSHIAIQDLLALGKFLLLPDDDLNLAALLKSPVINWPTKSAEDLLYRLAFGRGEHSLWQKLAQLANTEPNSDFKSAYDFLLHLWNMVDVAKPFELFSYVLDVRSGRQNFLNRLGAECLDPIDEFLNLCLASGEHTQNMQEFVEWFESGDTEIKRDMDNSERDEVRIMTVHAAKGLQAPIVFLADTNAPPKFDTDALLRDEQNDILLWPSKPSDSKESAIKFGYGERIKTAAEEKSTQEYNRLLYVAMTRAEDRLYVGCAGEPAEQSWYQKIYSSMPLLSHHPDAQSHEFDFSYLGFDNWRGMGWRIGGIIKDITIPADSAVDQIPTDISKPGWWSDQIRDGFTDISPKIRPATQPENDKHPVNLSPIAALGAIAPPKNRLRGEYIHRLLQSLPQIPVAQRSAAIQRFLKPDSVLDDHEKSQIATEVQILLDDPRFADYFGDHSRAEVPVSGKIGGQLIIGIIDRLVVSESTVKILDFKTNRPIPQSANDIPNSYYRQMAAYRELIRRIYPQKQVICSILWTNKPLLTLLPDGILDKFAP